MHVTNENARARLELNIQKWGLRYGINNYTKVDMTDGLPQYDTIEAVKPYKALFIFTFNGKDTYVMNHQAQVVGFKQSTIARLFGNGILVNATNTA